MSTESSLIAYIIKYNDLLGPQQQGIGQDHFHDEWRTVYRYLHRSRRDHGSVPSIDVVQARFPDLDFPRVRKQDLPVLVSDIRKRKRWIGLLNILDETARNANSPDEISDVIQNLQGALNTLNARDQHKSHLVDLFSAEASRHLRKEVKDRRAAAVSGLPTGLATFDAMCGGLQKQRMITVMARSGVGKSWLDLFFVAHAVSTGAKVILYPLEMTLYETAMRLYTIFTQMHFGHERVLKNLDLTQGHISTAKIARFTSVLEDKFAGQLYVADTSALSDPYTNERIEAEVEAHKPDMFWVDYITLLKAPGGARDEAGHEMISRLSKGIKGTSTRQNCVGGASAQVNRTGAGQGGLKKVFLPRLEHVAYGDAIGQDSDQVFSLAKAGDHLYYAVPKNRHGPEISKIRCTFDVNNGVLREYVDPDDEDDDD